MLGTNALTLVPKNQLLGDLSLSLQEFLGRTHGARPVTEDARPGHEAATTRVRGSRSMQNTENKQLCSGLLRSFLPTPPIHHSEVSAPSTYGVLL